MRVRNRSEQVLGLLLGARLIAAGFGPVLDYSPIEVELLVSLTVLIHLLIKAGDAYKVGGLVTPCVLDDLRMRIEIELIRPGANARLQSTLHRVAAHIVRSRIKAGIQQRLGIAKVFLCQLLEVVAVHPPARLLQCNGIRRRRPH